jgi:threonine/homoserine/homoserine lactone efflux protein
MNAAEVLVFLAQAVIISFSGVLAPGPVTAVTVGMGATNRHAGALVAIGHGLVEFPLMGLILLGVGKLLAVPAAKMGIGLAGGVMLVLMGAGMLRNLRKVADLTARPSRRSPILTGVVLSIGNPYFLLWWATVGLALASRAARLGALAFALFAVLHWLCDLVWLEILSWGTFRGSRLFGGRGQKVVLAVCGAALVVFGGLFLFGAGRDLVSMLTAS